MLRTRTPTAGLSPPARGSQYVPPPASPPWRSIPARAGEPRATPRRIAMIMVYPRPRGGANYYTARTQAHRVYPRPRGGAPICWREIWA